jgi:hypothetical protein
MGEDQRTDNLEAAKKLEGRSIKSIDLDERWASLTLKLDDGATVYVDALRTAELEVAYLSPDEVFEINNSVREEEIVDEEIERLRSEGHLPALFDDRLEWVELPPVSGLGGGHTWLTHEARIGLEGGVLRAYRVSDGTRLFDQRDVSELFDLAGIDHDEERIGKAIIKALTKREKLGEEPEE